MSRLPPSQFFPPAESADGDGLLAIGGKLRPEWLLDAYRHGIFPWPQSDLDDPMLWWSPDPRAVFEFDAFHVPKRLGRVCRGGRFTIVTNRDFEQVIRGCALENHRAGATWLTPRMIAAYLRLFRLGYVHSVEAWREERLAGGVYGVAIGGFFAAESMFYREPNASKIALVHLLGHLKARGYRLVDIQQLTPHTERFGAVEIPRVDYLRRLKEATRLPVTFGAALEPCDYLKT
jgi:leucyl/phenylalanyl-tRNA--protein transferase